MAHKTAVHTKARKFADRVLRTRIAKKMSQRSLAEAAGLSQPNIARIENGVTTPSFRSLISICNALDVSPNELLDYRRQT